mmetsp:Transcript_94767/g.219961  ORF Transcript_94767/g.219961 Transcript_94767/m.219961 type:complete len:465 (+) Transcript_94767:1503-2897(+)
MQVPLEILDRGFLILLVNFFCFLPGFTSLLISWGRLGGLFPFLTVDSQFCAFNFCRLARCHPGHANLVHLEVFLHLKLFRGQLEEVGPCQTLALLLVAWELADLCNGEDLADEHRSTLAFAKGSIHRPDKAVLQVGRQLIARPQLPGHVRVDLDVAFLEEGGDARATLGDCTPEHGLQEEVIYVPQQWQSSPQREDKLGSEAVVAKLCIANIDCALKLIEVDLLILLTAIDDGEGISHWEVLQAIVLFFFLLFILLFLFLFLLLLLLRLLLLVPLPVLLLLLPFLLLLLIILHCFIPFFGILFSFPLFAGLLSLFPEESAAQLGLGSSEPYCAQLLAHTSHCHPHSLLVLLSLVLQHRVETACKLWRPHQLLQPFFESPCVLPLFFVGVGAVNHAALFNQLRQLFHTNVLNQRSRYVALVLAIEGTEVQVLCPFAPLQPSGLIGPHERPSGLDGPRGGEHPQTA